MTRSQGKGIWMTVFTGSSGLTHYSFCLTRALSADGVDVTLVTNTNYETEALGGGFRVIKLFHRTRQYPLDIIRFWQRYRRERPAIVHYQAFLKFPLIEVILLKLQKRNGTRLVYTAHDWLPHRRRSHHSLLFRLYYRQFDRIIVHSERGAAFLEKELSVDPEKLSVIPHGEYGIFDLDPDMTREEARRRLGLDPETVWYLFFGHIDEYKGLDVTLRAFGRLRRAQDETGRRVGLIVAGNPGNGDFAAYAGLIEANGLADRISLNLGHIPIEDVQLYFKAADVLLLPYRESSTSGLAHVAMGFGKPVVASAVGGLPALIEEAGAGIMVAPGDEAGLAAAITTLAEDDERRARLGEAWTKVADKYSWDSIAGKTEAVYRSLAG